MKIYAEDSKIIFRCERCGGSAAIEKEMKKRSFQTLLNRFYRDHEGGCRYRYEVKKKIEVAGEQARSEISRIMAIKCKDQK